MSFGRIVTAALSAIVVLVLLLSIGSLVQFVDTGEAVRIRYPNGGVRWLVGESGPRLQLFGDVTIYQRRGTVDFQPAEDGGPEGRLSIDFNDRGTGLIQGSINYELSTDQAKLELMYANFRTQEALEESLVKPALNSSIYLTGQLMSSYESYSTRKSELVAYVEDQTQRGLYRTQAQQVEEVDELDPTKKTLVTKASIVPDQNAPLGRARTGGGEVDRYGIRVFQFAIEALTYDATVNKQIEAQQGITMSVQTSRARALEAAQNAITAVQSGLEKVAIAEAAQREKNATLVEAAKGLAAKAEQDRLAAEQTKQAQILLAQGEAEANRLRVVAGMTPQERGQLWLESQRAWAQAYSVAPVPGVMMGGSGVGNNASATQNYMDILGAAAARQLGLDIGLGVRPQSSAAPAPAQQPARGRGAAPAAQTQQARQQ